MSLVGNLEDLSLPDILQIVSLSKKSGILTIEREGQQGKIFIREGRVIQTVSPRSGKTLGEILTGRGLIRPDDLKRALEIQRTDGRKELLGGILVREKLILQEDLEKIVQEQIEESIVYFLSWKEGTFSFELSEIESRGEVSVDAHAFILEKGIDTQWLVLEGTRLMDERSRGGAVEDDGDFIEESEGGGEGGLRPVILVEDDAVFREMARERLERLGCKVTLCEGAEDALKAVRTFSSGSPPVVVTDIVYPTSDGRGFLGGLELIEKLRASHPEVPVVALTAYPDENVRGKMAEFGVEHFLIKPSGAESDGEGAQKSFFDKVAAALAGIQGAAPPPSPFPGPVEDGPDGTERDQLVEAITETKAALAERESALPAAGLDRDEMTLLQDMMAELQNPKASSEIGLLILRFASEMMNRAVLFIVRAESAAGLGGFGVDVSASGGKGVRGIRIPLTEPSVLEEVIRRRAPFRGPVVHTEWNVKLMQQLGGETPVEAVAMPLIASGKVRVILYGDNLPESKPLGGTQALEIFLTQAGLTLERVLLEKKLQESASAPGRT